MAESLEPKPEAEVALSARIEALRREIQSLVSSGAEHVKFEFKRFASISRENLDDRLDFVKLLQGMANAGMDGERCLVIGADQKSKCFHPVANSAEFDWASVTTILEKYLEPVPQFEVFNTLQTDEGVPFVLILLSRAQPRPIVVKSEAAKQDGKIRLKEGEIWVKRGTSLQIAKRGDLDAMYQQKVEEEAETRARQRFRHFSDVSRLTYATSLGGVRLPSSELLLGPVADLRAFVEEVVSSNDSVRLSMLVELGRDLFVDGLHRIRVQRPQPGPAGREYFDAMEGFFKDEFLPTLQSLVTIGILIIKYGAATEWVAWIVELMLEAFDAAREVPLELRAGYLAVPEGALEWWRPAFEIFIGARVLAIFSILRKRYTYLNSVLPRFVASLTRTSKRGIETPILLWPFPSSTIPNDELLQGRSSYYWKTRVAASWGEYFATFERFLGAACELEFLLEFNSYFGTNSLKDQSIQNWLQTSALTKRLSYSPDLFAYDLHWTYPMAEMCYDVIVSDRIFPEYLAIVPAVVNLAFDKKDREQRRLVYGGFLYHLIYWQEQAMMQMHRIPYMAGWEGRLYEAVEEFEKQRASGQPNEPGR